jgi:hypothetical protein
MCVMHFLLKPVPYITSHGSHTQNANLMKVIATPIHLFPFFIIFLYINKVCDVCDTCQSSSQRGLATHRFTPLYVRNTCVWVKSLIRLHEVPGLNKNALSLRGLLRCKNLFKVWHAASLLWILKASSLQREMQTHWIALHEHACKNQ